jgi:hypothetical protein
MSTRRLAAGLLCACLPALAQQPTAPPTPLYNIELVVFRATSALGAAENWSAEASVPNAPADEDNASAAAAAPAAPVAPPAAPPAAAAGSDGPPVRALPPDQYQLNDIEEKLRASGAYAPVAHLAWSQTATPWGSHATVPLQRLGADVPGLSGSVALERGQFLHLALALNYAIQNPPAGLNAPPGTTFAINDEQRVRFYERNYFDHPAFGVIALVTPAQGTRAAGR